MADGEVDGQELPVERAVLRLRRPESAGEKGEWFPFSFNVLFQDSADTNVAGVGGQGGGRLHGWVNQHRGRGQCLFGRFESCVQLWRPRHDLCLFFTGGGGKERGQPEVDVGHIFVKKSLSCPQT